MEYINNFIRITFIAILTFLKVTSISGTTTNFEFEYDLSNVEINQISDNAGQRFEIINMEGLRNSGEYMEPLLPRATKIFRVPSSAYDFHVEIKNLGMSKTFKLDYPLCPMENIEAGISNTFTSGNNNLGPSYLLSKITPGIDAFNEFILNGDEHYIEVSFSPVCYNGPEKIVTIYSYIELELSYSEGHDSKLFSQLQSPGNIRMFKVEDYINSEVAYQQNKLVSSSHFDNLCSTYIILVPEELKPSVMRLAHWKEQKGYNVVIKTIEEIICNPIYSVGSSAKCFDKESSVREWLKTIYKSYGAAYCLIVGDYRTSSPIRKFKNGSTDLSDPNHQLYLPTDVYFSDLVTEWDFTKDNSGIYTTINSGRGFSPTISVGRLLASKSSEIENFTDKVILYELYPGLGDASYLNRAFLGRHYDSVRYNRENLNLFDSIPGLQVTQIDGNIDSKLANIYPKPKEVLDVLKDVGIASLQYHGSPISLTLCNLNVSGWPDSRYIVALSDYTSFHSRFSADKDNGLDLIGNKTKPSIIYSLACTIAPFDCYFSKHFPDLENVPDTLHTFAGAFTVSKDFGGPVCLANTREGFFSVSSILEQEFGKYINKGYSIGIAEGLSKINLTGSSSSHNQVRLVHSIIGDPEIRVWTKEPSYVNFTSLFNEEGIILKYISLNNANIGISCGLSHEIRNYTSFTGDLTIPVKTMIGGENYTEIASVYLSNFNAWPETFLYPMSDSISGFTKTYNVNRFYIGKHDMPIHCPILRIGDKSRIEIDSYTNISSSSGIEINHGGSLILNALEKASLKDDVVRTGGSLNIVSKRSVLDKGFTVEKGGSLTINK